MILYKLIESHLADNFGSKKRISLSRPLNEFGVPEGLAFDFFRKINEVAKCTDSFITPPENILLRIKEWCASYFESTYPQGYCPQNVKSELFNILTVYFQTYCGYFTYDNLFDKKTLVEYLKLNSGFVEKYKKTYVLQAEFPDDDSIWKLNCQFDEWIFEKVKEKQFGLIGYLRNKKVVYLENNIKDKDIFDLFNNIDDRRASSLFKYTKKYLENQHEQRIIFNLPSYHAGESRIAHNYPHEHKFSSLEEEIFFYCLEVARDAIKNSKKYLYLKIDNLNIRKIDDILGEKT